jgi:Anaerobic ribonucleoside-triphosphate reductase
MKPFWRLFHAPLETENKQPPTTQRTNNMTSSPPSQLKDEDRTRCEVWTRVMGYHRPVSQFNRGKQSEHRERTHFTEARAAAAAQTAAAA